MADRVLITSKPRVGEWQPIFLATLRASGNVRLACQQAGISRQTALRRREQSAGFAAQWDLAGEDAIDLLEAMAWRKARAGSDQMIIFLLKSLRRQQYGDKSTVEHKISAAAKQEVVRLAEQEGLDPEVVLAEVERHLKVAAGRS